MKLFVHLEDPGAVRFVAPLLRRLADTGREITLVSSGVATSMLGELSPRPVSRLQDVYEDLNLASLVLVGTSENLRTIAFEIIGAARDANIPSVGAVDAFVNAKYRFAGLTKNSLAHAPDWLMVPSGRVSGIFADLGFSRERIFVVGHPARDGPKHRKACREPNSPKRVVFVSEVSTGLNPNQYRKSSFYTLHGRGGSLLRTKIVVEELLDAVSELRKNGEQIEMILRLHPKEKLHDLGSLVREFNTVSSGGDPLELLQSADLVIGMSSMLLSEAHTMGLPCLAILPREEEIYWLDETADGSVKSVTLRESIVPAIEGLLAFSLTLSSTENVRVSAVEKMIPALMSVTKARKFR